MIQYNNILVLFFVPKQNKGGGGESKHDMD